MIFSHFRGARQKWHMDCHVSVINKCDISNNKRCVLSNDIADTSILLSQASEFHAVLLGVYPGVIWIVREIVRETRHDCLSVIQYKYTCLTLSGKRH